MFERYCLLRSGAAFIMSISTLSVVAQDTPVGPGRQTHQRSIQNNSNFGIGPYNLITGPRM